MAEVFRVHSLRKAIREGKSFGLLSDFWPAFEAELRILHAEGLFEREMDLTRSYSLCGYGESHVQTYLARQYSRTPWKPDQWPKEDHVFDYVEFFSLYAAIPRKGHALAYTCRDDQVASVTGKNYYSTKVNLLFDRFLLPFRLESNQVLETSSKPLDEGILAWDLKSDDQELLKLIVGSVDAYYDAREERKSEALKLIVDAFDRLKLGFVDSDKRESVQECARTLSSVEKMQNQLRKLIEILGAIANDASDIRHSEKRDEPLTEGPLKEFLFYLYFSFVRLILKSQESKEGAKHLA